MPCHYPFHLFYVFRKGKLLPYWGGFSQVVEFRPCLIFRTLYGVTKKISRSMIILNTSLLMLADYFFIIIHTILILFNLFGWIWKPFRKWHFAAISITFGSWVILGIWYGWGYCPLTDWHWNVLTKLGATGLPSSYISYLIYRLIGLDISPHTMDVLTISFAVAALVISIKVNFGNLKD